MTAHNVILPVILPAVVAGLLVLGRGNLAVQRGLGLAASLALLAVVLFNMGQASAGPIPYFLGNWPAPFGIVLVLDRLSALMLLLVAGLALPALVYAVQTGWDARAGHFHTLFQFQLMGLNGAFLTADAFNLFVFFEVLLIASYGLLVHSGGAQRMRVGLQYVVFNLIGSAVFLFALSVIYAATGTLNMADLAVKLPLMAAQDTAFVRTAAVLFLVVFAIKGAMVPLGFWLPRAYAAAPAPVAALFAVMTKLGAYAMIRFGTLIFPPDLPATGQLWGDLIWAGGLASVALGAAGVLATRRLDVAAGFAMISSMGVVFIGMSAFSAAALVASLFYMVQSTLAAALMFLLAQQITAQRGRVLAGLYLLAAMAMIGLPPLPGFLGKIMVLQSLQGHAVLGFGVILGGALVCMTGFARMGSTLFWRDAAPRIGPIPALLPISMLVAALIGMSLCATPITDWLTILAQDLIAPHSYISVQSLPQVAP